MHRKMRRSYFSIPPDRGDRKQPMICSPATDARGEGYKRVMPVAAETYSLGTPVEIGKIEQELKRLWREGEGAMTRASLMNLAVYSEQPGSLNNNTQLMAKITENHACRAIVTEADCRSERALSREQCRKQTSLLRTNFIPAQRRMRHTIAEHRPFQSGFGSAALSLVAGRISRTDGSTTLDVG